MCIQRTRFKGCISWPHTSAPSLPPSPSEGRISVEDVTSAPSRSFTYHRNHVGLIPCVNVIWQRGLILTAAFQHKVKPCRNWWMRGTVLYRKHASNWLEKSHAIPSHANSFTSVTCGRSERQTCLWLRLWFTWRKNTNMWHCDCPVFPPKPVF